MPDILLIIGASSDIGKALIQSIEDECLIIAHYHRSDTELLELQKSISNRLVTVQADLRSEDAVAAMLETIESDYGVPDKIVHLAAPRVKNIRFKDTTWSDFEQDLHVSFRSLILVLNRFLPKLAKQKRGKVVVMLSSYVMGVPPKALSHYTSVKYALLGLVKSLASEYADKNIQINAVSPSMVETKFLSDINEKIVELAAYNHPLKRNARTSDVVPVIKLLLSEASDYMCGTNIAITGGETF